MLGINNTSGNLASDETIRLLVLKVLFESVLKNMLVTNNWSQFSLLVLDVGSSDQGFKTNNSLKGTQLFFSR